MKNTIAEQWAAFEALVMPKDAPPVQRQEMRRAFYSGAEAMLRLQYAAGDPSVSEEGGVLLPDGRYAIKRGRSWAKKTPRASLTEIFTAARKWAAQVRR